MISLARTILIVMLLPSTLTLGGSVPAQTPADKKSQTRSEVKTKKGKAKLGEADLLEAQRRTFAISLVMSLANEARSYRDVALRARVLARTGDILWEADSDAARTLFRRAWDAAEKAATDDPPTPTKDAGPALLIAFGSMRNGDVRSQVLTLAARRDRALGEEFLTRLTNETNNEAANAMNDADRQSYRDSWSTTQAASKRLPDVC